MLSVFVVFTYNIINYIALLILIGFVVYLVKWKPKIDITRNIPSPPSLPIIGHSLFLTNVARDEHLNFCLNMTSTYGKTFKFWVVGKLYIAFLEPSDVECILNDRRFIDKPFMYSFFEPWLKEGLLISERKKWQKRRKILIPAFHFQILKEFVQIFEKQSRIFLKNLQKECNMQKDEGFELDKLLEMCTLDVICESIMGVSINAQNNSDLAYVKALRTISNAVYSRVIDMRYFFDVTFRFTRLYRESQKALSVLHGFTESVIVKRRAELLKTSAHDKKPNEAVEGIKQKMVFLDILLHSQIDGKPLSNSDIREEVDTFMFGGHDTIGQALLFLFYNLGLYRECQQKVWEEIIQVVGEDKTKPLTYEDLNKFDYMELCIKETLRMYPSAPVMGRYTEEEREINGKIIPADTTLVFSSILMGRQPDIFPEPLIFKPERFVNITDGSKLHPYSCIPFSVGPRNCIGQKFAMLEIKTIVANSLRYYEFESLGDKNEELQLSPEIVLRPKHTLMFKIKSRV